MKKKVLSIIIIIIGAIAIISGGSYIYLSKNSIKTDMKQANTLMSEGNYTAALNEYGVVLNKDPNNIEAKNIENIINGYLTAKNDYDQGEMQAAMTAINGIKDYSGYAIAENINELKSKIETSEKQRISKNEPKNTKSTEKIENTKKVQSVTNTTSVNEINNQKNNTNTIEPKVQGNEKNENNQNNQNTTQNITKEAQKSNSKNLISKQDYLDQLNATKERLNNYISGQSQTAMNAQSYEMYNIWNNKLNQIWGVLEQRLPADKMATLKASENTWIKDKEAKAQAVQKQYEGGSIMPLEVNMELANLTEQRCYYLVNNYM